MATLGGHCVRARSRLAGALIIEPQRQRPSQRMQLPQDNDPRALQSGRPIATLEPAGKAKLGLPPRREGTPAGGSHLWAQAQSL